MRVAWMAAAIFGLVMLGGGLLSGLSGQGRSQDRPTVAAERADGLATAIFAAGCFWCVEAAFDAVEGVEETVSGYIGGAAANPTYRQVSNGGTGHAEAVRVRYDPAVVDYWTLLTTYWTNVDPLDGGGQFCDRGSQYRGALFPLTADQRQLAERSKQQVAGLFDRPIATTIEDAGPFWPAEAYHQNYHQENPTRYSWYTWGCGRKERLKEVWGDKPRNPLAPVG